MFRKVTTCLMAVLALVCMATVDVSAQMPADEGGVAVVLGPRLSDGGQWAVSFGMAKQVKGGLWALSYADVGDYATWSNELCYYYTPPTPIGVSIGLVAGVNADWIEIPETGSPLAYIPGAAGATFTVPIGASFGVAGLGKYKFSFDGDNLYQDGWYAAVGLFYRIE